MHPYPAERLDGGELLVEFLKTFSYSATITLGIGLFWNY